MPVRTTLVGCGHMGVDTNGWLRLLLRAQATQTFHCACGKAAENHKEMQNLVWLRANGGRD